MVVGRRPPKMMAEMGTPSGSSQSGSMDGHWRCGRGEAAVGMRGGLAGGFADLGGPAFAAPVEAFGGRLGGHALPPDAAVGGEGDVGEDGVARESGHGVGVGGGGGAGGDAEEAGLGVDGAELALASGLIQAMSSPTVQTFQPSKPAGGMSMAKLVLPQAEGKAAAT